MSSPAAHAAPDTRPLVVHVVYRFDVGGLENGVVNLINHMPRDRFRHAVVALTEVTDFARRIRRDDVPCIALHKPPGHAVALYPRLWRLFRDLKPAIVHTRNLAALECVVPAWAAGVPVRIHGEHGRDVDDLDGRSRKHWWVRRVYRPWVSHYIALSEDLAGYLRDRVGVSPQAVSQIYNGVDSDRFRPADASREGLPSGFPFERARHWVVGTVGRLQAVKDQATLARAFAMALGRQPDLRDRLRLVIVGDGPSRLQVQRVVSEAGVADLCWFAGERHDVPELMRAMDCFVLPSLAEGVSNTVLEAMASGLPIVATAVGGNPELVDEGRTGLLVPAGDAEAMATALLRLSEAPERARAMGREARAEVERRFSLSAMVQAYSNLYRDMLGESRWLPAAV